MVIELDSETQKILDTCYTLLQDIMSKDPQNVMLVNMFANTLVVNTLLLASNGVYDDSLLKDELDCIRSAYSELASSVLDTSKAIH